MDTINYMDEVLDYYSFWGKDGEKALANYMMGCVYRDRGNSPMALQYYNEAVVKMIQQNETVISLCCLNLWTMADVYRLQRYPQMELKILDKKAQVALKMNDTLGYARVQERRGSVYYQLGYMDSVFILPLRLIDITKIWVSMIMPQQL